MDARQGIPLKSNDVQGLINWPKDLGDHTQSALIFKAQDSILIKSRDPNNPLDSCAGARKQRQSVQFVRVFTPKIRYGRRQKFHSWKQNLKIQPNIYIYIYIYIYKGEVLVQPSWHAQRSPWLWPSYNKKSVRVLQVQILMMGTSLDGAITSDQVRYEWWS